MRWAGPMFVYSQWTMERFYDTLAGTAKSRVSTNRNLSNNLIMMEQKSTLIYVIDHGVPQSSDEDPDGNVQLSKFLTKRLKKSIPATGPAIHDQAADSLLFRGPAKVYIFAAYERSCLKAFFLNEELQIYDRDDADLDAEANSFDIPTYCRTFRSAQFNTGHRGDSYPFRATSLICQRSDQSRSTLLIRYESPSAQ